MIDTKLRSVDLASSKSLALDHFERAIDHTTDKSKQQTRNRTGFEQNETEMIRFKEPSR